MVDSTNFFFLNETNSTNIKIEANGLGSFCGPRANEFR